MAHSRGGNSRSFLVAMLMASFPRVLVVISALLCLNVSAVMIHDLDDDDDDGGYPQPEQRPDLRGQNDYLPQQGIHLPPEILGLIGLLMSIPFVVVVLPCILVIIIAPIIIFCMIVLVAFINAMVWFGSIFAGRLF